MVARTLSDTLTTLDIEQIAVDEFLATQMDNAAHHIVGGHIAAQALMSASRTVTADRTPHSMHVYLLRAGDARRPVHFEITRLRDGGVLSSRRVLARQDDRGAPARPVAAHQAVVASRRTDARRPHPQQLPVDVCVGHRAAGDGDGGAPDDR